MTATQASVEIPTPARYMARARIEFPNGLCSPQAADARLEMRIEVSDTQPWTHSSKWWPDI